MKRLPLAALLALTCALLAACAGGPIRRVSDPAAGIQQLTVHANGEWTVALRIDNFSSIPMRFDAVDIALTVDGVAAGALRGNAGITIGPESADVATLQLTPPPGAKIAIADALARGSAIGYALEGTITATPEDGNRRVFEFERNNALAPVPGLPGVLR